jgi:hypothetical protein
MHSAIFQLQKMNKKSGENSVDLFDSSNFGISENGKLVGLANLSSLYPNTIRTVNLDTSQLTDFNDVYQSTCTTHYTNDRTSTYCLNLK